MQQADKQLSRTTRVTIARFEFHRTGLSAQRIYQDVVAEEQFAAGYDPVKRFIRALERSQPLPFRRMECAPGVEVQVARSFCPPSRTPRATKVTAPLSGDECDDF